VGTKKKKPAQVASVKTKTKTEVDRARRPPPAGPSRLPDLLHNMPAKKKRPYEYVEASEDDEEEIEELVDDMDDEGEDFTTAMRMIDDASSDAQSSEDEDGQGDDGDWEYSLRSSAGTSKKRRVSVPSKGPSKRANKRDSDDEVISLASD